jgi:hypothetical protein
MRAPIPQASVVEIAEIGGQLLHNQIAQIDQASPDATAVDGLEFDRLIELVRSQLALLTEKSPIRLIFYTSSTRTSSLSSRLDRPAAHSS